jgi:hypothetical protein
MLSQKEPQILFAFENTADNSANPQGLSAATDRNEKASLVPDSPHPSDLRQPPLNAPVVCSACEQRLRLFTQYCTRVRAHIFHVICGKPALDLGQGMTMFLGMLILVPHPCLAPCKLALSVAQHRIARDESVSRQSRDEAPGAERHACECVVDSDNDHATWACQSRDACECCTWVWSVV